jgi:Spy/CpxP family protein refolding chaperone
MRKIVLALAALAALGLAVPVVSTPAEARDVVVIKKKKMKHYGHRGYRGHHYGWQKKRHHRGGRTKVIIR